MRPATYQIEEEKGEAFYAMRLNVVATFLEESLAAEFAAMKNTGGGNCVTSSEVRGGTYTVSLENGEYMVSRSENVAIFFDGDLADEYAAIKNGSAAPLKLHAVPQPAPKPVEQPIDNDKIWAEAAAMINGGR